jgi:hypothetical protein
MEAAEPVPWTKPEDPSYTPDGPLPKVGGLVGNGFHALFADGTVRWIEAEEQESALRNLVPRMDADKLGCASVSALGWRCGRGAIHVGVTTPAIATRLAGRTGPLLSLANEAGHELTS